MTRHLVTFFPLTFGITWICWMAAGVISRRGAPSDAALVVLAGALFLLGTFAPGLVAVALTARAGGRAATRALLRRVVDWRVDVRWYLFAVGYIPAVELAVAVAHRLATGAWPRFGETAWYLMAIAVVFSTWVQAGEEVGWRGYALPRLSERFGLAAASVILGIIWAAWHLPLFFVPHTDTFGQSFPLYLLQVTALSVTMAWLCWRTGASLFPVMVLHAAINNTKDIVPSAAPGATNAFTLAASLVAWITVAVLWVTAAYFLLRMRGAGALPRGDSERQARREIASATRTR